MRRHLTVAAACGLFVATMLGAAYAAVPLYSMFCKLTGYAGTPRIAVARPTQVLDRSFEVRFDSNVNGLPWTFKPEAETVAIKAGEVKTIYYRITNTSDHATRGLAAYNVTPEETAPYFSKISCFCFSQQTLGPHESLELPVVFFIDPAAAGDPTMDGIDHVTLSYTFFPTKTPPTRTPVAATTAVPSSAKL